MSVAVLAVSDARRRLLRARLRGGCVRPAVRQSATRDAAFFQVCPPPVAARRRRPALKESAHAGVAELVCGARVFNPRSA